MDGQAFDRLARAVAGVRSRRSLGRLVAAAGLAAVGGRARQDVAEAACAGYGCPCASGDQCVDGLVCCPYGPQGNMCATAEDCGLYCAATGDACPPVCEFGEPCSACCEGFCAHYGGCTSLYYSDEGGPCSLADPTACAPGLTCCPRRRRHNEGVCRDWC